MTYKAEFICDFYLTEDIVNLIDKYSHHRKRFHGYSIKE